MTSPRPRHHTLTWIDQHGAVPASVLLERTLLCVKSEADPVPGIKEDCARADEEVRFVSES